MPKVQEYLPEQNAQEPVGQTSPMLEQVGMFGRGIQDFGRDTTDALVQVQQRKTQEESSDAYAVTSQARADFMDRIQQETNDGTLDDKGLEKIKKDYQDWTEKQFDSYSTPGGKDAFVKTSSRTGASILMHAVKGQAAVSGTKAATDIQTMTNNDSNVIMKDPSQLQDLMENQHINIQSQIDNGVFSPKVGEQILKATDIEYAKSAARGWMQSDYNNIKQSVITAGGKGKIDPNTDQLNTAKLKLDTGAFDSILDSDKKKELYEEIKRNQQAAIIAGHQVIDQKEVALAAKGDAAKVEWNVKLLNNALTPDEVTAGARSGIIKPQQQLEYYHLIDQATKKQLVTDPKLQMDLFNRMHSADNEAGHISDSSQLAPYVGRGLSIHDYNSMSAQINKIPGNADHYNEGQLFKQAQATIGSTDPLMHNKMIMFNNEIQEAKKQMIAEGKPISQLFDPKSPNFMGNQINKYMSTPQEIFKAQADRFRGIAPAPVSIQAKPGVIPQPVKDWTDNFRSQVSTEEFKKNIIGGGYATDAQGNKIPNSNYIGNMSVEQMRALDPSKLTFEEKALVKKRYKAMVGNK